MNTVNKTPGGIEYILERKNRKTIAVKITPEGKVIASIPVRCSKVYAEQFMDEKAQWIGVKLKEIRLHASRKVNLNYTDGESIEVLGNKYILKVTSTKKRRSYLSVEAPFLNIFLSEDIHEKVRGEEVKKILKQWLVSFAQTVFQESVEFYSKRMGLRPNKITIKEQKTLWGSCSSKNNLNFNWKLVTAPRIILDYVVVHELCHMRHRNHSKDYWSYVEDIIPDYKEKIKWLKYNGSKLGI